MLVFRHILVDLFIYTDDNFDTYTLWRTRKTLIVAELSLCLKNAAWLRFFPTITWGMKSLSDTALWTQTHNNRLLLEISINITLCACMRFCYRRGFRNVWSVSVHISLPGPCYQVLTVTHEVTSYHKEMDSLWHLAICLHFSLSDIGNHILTLHSRQATTDWRLPCKASYLCFLPGVLC